MEYNQNQPKVDMDLVNGMVDDLYRSLLRSKRKNEFSSFQERFKQLVVARTEMMPSEDADRFVDAICTKRDLLFDEYCRDRQGMMRRLGVQEASTTRGPASNGSGITQTVVKTAVRATVWESIFSIFRAFR